ncbi:NTP transferase domain-containing protein [Pseudovibrio sp. Ad26]|uniref:nucleotidyltransferase family protein n=1 Tax=Pseudovibrio sp. Ad26 TaxID=989410 RepID=UPI0007B1A2A7|nr:NTP transferase domain-containing protein [Pseudovibrio sp. Ad26]KZL05062.1 MobA-like NTP transferase domain protein [Pseudovibrio sp. Ad26]
MEHDTEVSKLFPHALILAAGNGTRMRPLTGVVPKPLAPFNGSTLISQGVRMLRPWACNIFVTVGYMGDRLAKHVISLGAAGVFETSGNPNGWWIANTLLSYVDEPILVSTCDNLYDIDFVKLHRDYRSAGSPACMIIPVKPEFGAGDRIECDKQYINDIGPHLNQPLLASGMQILRPASVARLAAGATDFLSIWHRLILHQELYVSRVLPKQWAAVDTIDDLIFTEKTWQQSSTPLVQQELQQLNRNDQAMTGVA